jgi:hypothetical protein
MDRPGSRLRRLIGLLLILNLGILLAGLAEDYWRQQRPPLVTFNADKIQLLDDVLPEQPAATPAQQGDTAANGLPAQADCPAWKSLDANSVAQIVAHLRELGVADAAYDLVVEMRLGWWVYIPPLADVTALHVVMQDARSKGVTDMAPVRSGSMVNALALGTFPTMDGARKQAQILTRKGLSGVRFAPRPGAGRAHLVVVQDSPALQQALSAPWPVGLEPDACGAK